MVLTTKGQHDEKRSTYATYRDQLVTKPAGRFSADSLIHVERTLDEYFFLGLNGEELNQRNDEQIVSRKWKKENVEVEVEKTKQNHEKKEEQNPVDKRDMPILVVPQIWLWRFSNVIVSAHSIDLPSNTFARRGDYIIPNISHPLDATYQVGLCIADYIQTLGEGLEASGTRKRVAPPLEHYESTVEGISRLVRAAIHDRRDIDLEEEVQLLRDLSDCRAELAMIQRVLDEQKQVLEAFIKYKDGLPQGTKATGMEKTALAASKNSEQDQNVVKDGGELDVAQKSDWQLIENSRTRLRSYQDRVRAITATAERTESDVQTILDCRRAHASMKDATASVILSLAAVVFAIITILFTPLAFLVGLFALDIHGFDRLRVSPTDSDDDSKGSLEYESWKMAGILGKYILKPTMLYVHIVDAI